jgi:hypothetical protein
VSEGDKLPFWRKENPIAWGIGLTVTLAATVVVLAILPGPELGPRYREFSDLPSNAIGDTLAGIFAPLAFIWIVVTVFLQSLELAEQRKELALTRIELQLAREAQEAQLKVMQKQADIFDDEKRRRDQLESGRVLEELLKDCLALIYRTRNISWREPHELDTSADSFGRTASLHSTAIYKGKLDEHSLMGMAKSLRDRHKSLRAFALSGTLRDKPVRPEAIKQAGLSLIEIDDLFNFFDKPTQIRVKRWNVRELAEVLFELYHDDTLWNPVSTEAIL